MRNDLDDVIGSRINIAKLSILCTWFVLRGEFVALFARESDEKNRIRKPPKRESLLSIIKSDKNENLIRIA